MVNTNKQKKKKKKKGEVGGWGKLAECKYIYVQQYSQYEVV